MIDKATYQALLEQMRQAGVLAQPSALEEAMAALQAAPQVLGKLMQYLVAKQELAEMNRELVKLQSSVRELEHTLESSGPAACGRSGANHTFVNWTVSFVESYHGLAQALQAQQAMIPRVQAYLRGEHKRSSMFRMVDAILSKPPVQQGPHGQSLTKALEAAMTRVPPFLRS